MAKEEPETNTKSVDAIIRESGSSAQEGISDSQATAKLTQFGRNILAPKKEIKIWGYLAFLKEPMIWLLGIAGTVYYWLGDYTEAAITLAAIVPIAILDIVIELQTDKALEKLKRLGEPEVTVVRGGVEKKIKTEELVPGDIVLLQEGNVVMADCAVLSGSDIRADESALTGESQAVEKRPEKAVSDEMFANPGMLFAGTTLVSGRCRCIVAKTGANTSYGKIGKMLASTTAGKTPLQAEIDQIVEWFGIFAIALSVILFIIELFTSGPINSDTWKHAIISGVSLAIAAIPEEFPVVFTLFLSLGMLKLANSNSLVKKLSAVEALGSVDAICTDKTGTITTGKVAVCETVRSIGADERTFALCAIMACEPDPFDPMDKAIYANDEKGGSKAIAELKKWRLVEEYAFNPHQKYMSHIWKGRDLRLTAKGSVEGILAHCKLSTAERAAILRNNAEMAGRGIRILALAYKKLDRIRNREKDEAALTFLGLIGFADPIRHGVTAAVGECRSAGVRVVMITGDHKTTAEAIAKEAGIATAKVVEGSDLGAEKKFMQTLESTSVFARVLPEQKLRIVEGLQKLGYRVAVTGDGINDAPALKKADISVAMGERGTEVAKETASIVLLDDNFKTIVTAIRNGRRIYDNLRKAFAYLVVFHVPIFLSALILPLAGLPLLLLPVHIVFLELILHPVISIVFEKEPEEKDVMNRPPRKKGETILNKPELASLAAEGTALFVGVVAAFAWALSYGEEYARSFALCAMVIGQILLIASKLSKTRFRLSHLLSNRYLAPTIIAGVGAYAVLMYVPAAASVMGITPLGPSEWALATAIGLMPFALSEALKARLAGKRK